jgi:betaine-aldehyde dehydrogenase
VLEGANVERAANAATFGSFFNSGQTCIATERIYVEEPVYDEFVERLTAETEKLRQGVDGREISMDVGAMTSPDQIGIVEDHVRDALANGARALTGGGRADGPGSFHKPTVLVDVDHSMKVMRDETFGPVVGVMRVRDADEAVRLANDTRYGLSGAVFGPRRQAEAVARRVECGAINVNDVLVNYLASDVPMGGWKTSGIGYRHGVNGIRKYCRSESLVVSRLTPKREPTWYPYEPKRRNQLRRLLRFFAARDLRRRLGLGGKD